jgi:hypothetical protein
MLKRFTFTGRRGVVARLRWAFEALSRGLGSDGDGRDVVGQIQYLGPYRPEYRGRLIGRQAYVRYVIQRRLIWDRGGVRAAWPVHSTMPLRRCLHWEN